MCALTGFARPYAESWNSPFCRFFAAGINLWPDRVHEAAGGKLTQVNPLRRLSRHCRVGWHLSQPALTFRPKAERSSDESLIGALSRFVHRYILRQEQNHAPGDAEQSCRDRRLSRAALTRTPHFGTAIRTLFGDD
jgi:hypothetical protein